jgi:hypothetical protein
MTLKERAENWDRHHRELAAWEREQARDRQFAALKERIEKPAAALGRMEKKRRKIPWQDKASPIVDANPDMKKAPLARKVRKNLEARGVKRVPEDDKAIITFITNRRKIISDV